MEQTLASPCRWGMVTYTTGEKNNAAHTIKSHWLSVNLSWNCGAAKEKNKNDDNVPSFGAGSLDALEIRFSA